LLLFMNPMRIVLDTDVLVAALRSKSGASRRVLVDALQRRFTLLLSVPLAFEYEAVLTRDSHMQAAGLSLADISVLLDAVVAVAEPVRLRYLWRPALRDPDDDMVLETAVNGRADVLATFNLRDFGSVGSQFGLHVCRPADALIKLEARS